MNRLAISTLLLLAALPVRAARLELKPCRLPEIESEALRCGTYEVFEAERARRQDRIPALTVL
jgi:hypothetical protein